MEKLIIVGGKEALSRIDIIKNIIASNATEILIVTPESPDYKEIMEKANSSVIILNDTTPKTLKKEISEEFNKIFKLKSQKFLNENIIINETPRYNRFLKKGNKHDYQTLKPNSKKKWNKRK